MLDQIECDLSDNIHFQAIVSKESKIKIYMVPVKTRDRSDLIYSWRSIHGVHRCRVEIIVVVSRRLEG